LIITDEALLRVRCEDVLPNEVNSIRQKLEYELRLSELAGAPGIGLAAPQIGINKNMFIVRIPTIDRGIISFDVVNAKIKERYDPSVFLDEGCLSFPGKFVRTIRHAEIYVTSNLVEPHSFIAIGLAAACIEHEMDHLNGKLLIDYEKSK